MFLLFSAARIYATRSAQKLEAQYKQGRVVVK